jgi:hypothetical protein
MADKRPGQWSEKRTPLRGNGSITRFHCIRFRCEALASQRRQRLLNTEAVGTAARQRLVKTN